MNTALIWYQCVVRSQPALVDGVREAHAEGATEIEQTLHLAALREQEVRIRRVVQYEAQLGAALSIADAKALDGDEIENAPIRLDDVGKAERADIDDAVVEPVVQDAEREIPIRDLEIDRGIENVGGLARERPRRRRLHLPVSRPISMSESTYV